MRRKFQLIIQRFSENDNLITAFKKSNHDADCYEHKKNEYKKTSFQRFCAFFYFNPFLGAFSGIVFGIEYWYYTILFCLTFLQLLPSFLFEFSAKRNRV